MVDTFHVSDGTVLVFPTRGNKVKMNDIWYLRSDGERVLEADGIIAELQPIKRREQVSNYNWR